MHDTRCGQKNAAFKKFKDLREVRASMWIAI
jgi:hypothetical protein